MRIINDKYGREIISDGSGNYTGSGMTFTCDSDEQAINSFNAMAPEGWFDPTPDDIISQQIQALDDSITTRMLSEASINSDATGDINGTRQTAGQYIAWVLAEKAALRAQLNGG